MRPMKGSRRDFIRTSLLAVPLLGVPSLRAAASPEPSRLPSIDLQFVASQMELVRRNEWTGVLPKTWLLRRAEDFSRLTVHHVGENANANTDRNQIIRDLDGILTEHIDRQYGDIGYHFVIDAAGRVWEGRSLAFEGAHVSGQNDGNIGVVILGNFDRQALSVRQETALARLTWILRDRFGIKPQRVYGHRDLNPTACPGDNLYAALAALRQ